MLLHDHLDGGLRPDTILELAEQTGYRSLPSRDSGGLARWMHLGAERLSLELYLETFAHTVGVMQTADAVARVAAECAEDLAADGVVYAEVRFAPELFTRRGLSLDEATDAALDGFTQGSKGRPIRVTGILVAMRDADRCMDVAELALRWRDRGVVGFDIAGPEAGYPPTRYLEAFQALRREGFHYTIHAGEGFGLPSIRRAVYCCGAERLGHGVRIVEDVHEDASSPGGWRLGRLAAYVRDRRIPLELCPSSNVHTGVAASIARHPVDLLKKLGFRVTLNTDNRLMSNTSLSREMLLCSEAFGWTLEDLQELTINAAKSAFIPLHERLSLIEDVILPGYAAQGQGGRGAGGR